MNKLILIFAAAFIWASNAFCQDLTGKIPSNASMVIKYSGDNFSKNLPVKKLESYPFIKDNLFKMLHVDSLTTLENTGIDLEKDMMQYLVTADSTMNFVTMMHLKNASQFLKLLDAQSTAELKPEKKNGYEFISISGNTYAAWNNDWAMIVYSNYDNPNRYAFYYATDSTTVAESVSDTLYTVIPDTVAVPNEVIVEVPKEEIKKPKTTKSKTKSKITPRKPAAKNKKKAPVKEPVIEEVIIEETPSHQPKDEEMTYPPLSDQNHDDSIREAKRIEEEKIQEKITNDRQKKVSAEIIEKSFNGNEASIQNEVSYTKIVDPAAHISGWFNYTDFMKQYWNLLYGRFMHYPRSFFTYGEDAVDKSGKNKMGMHSSVNIYFDKDKMRVDQKTFCDGDMEDFGKDLYSSKQDAAIVKFVNPDNVGYLSASINTEAMAKYYYKWIKEYLSSNSYMGKYADLIDVYIDLMEIVIDEKAISDLMPGNYLLVLHDLKTKEVSYTSYTYDDDFKMTEVKKTKQELSPNFTFVMGTRNEAFMKKLANVPVKHSKPGELNYIDRGGYYELVIDSGKGVIGNMYFLVKDGKVIITTSKTVIDMTLGNTGFEPDAETKKSILKNNYSFKLNTKRMIQQIGPELNAGTSKKISEYLMDNIGDFTMESKLKDGMIQGTTTMAITGNHANSLEFFFNMIDSINDIIKKSKEESEQKFN